MGQWLARLSIMELGPQYVFYTSLARFPPLPSLLISLFLDSLSPSRPIPRHNLFSHSGRRSQGFQQLKALRISAHTGCVASTI